MVLGRVNDFTSPLSSQNQSVKPKITKILCFSIHPYMFGVIAVCCLHLYSRSIICLCLLCVVLVKKKSVYNVPHHMAAVSTCPSMLAVVEFCMPHSTKAKNVANQKATPTYCVLCIRKRHTHNKEIKQKNVH
jgi:hypothetical protein